jgi:hypothetical protein
VEREEDGVEREKEKNEENKEENKRKNSPFLAVLPFHNHDQTNKQYQRAYRSICPSEWLEKWAEQREAGEFWFFGFLSFSSEISAGYFSLTFLFSLWFFSVPFFSTLETPHTQQVLTPASTRRDNME